MANVSHKRYNEIMRDVERLIDDHSKSIVFRPIKVCASK